MGKIFYIMGKSSSGKDTIYNRLRIDEGLKLSNLILYTTRPMREGEIQYPPGIPLLTPGEKIDRQFLEQALKWKKQGLYLQGLQDYTQEFIWVLDR